MAEAVGKSVGWVNALLKWRRSGYKGASPFGPTTIAARVQHAEQRAKRSKLRKARQPKEPTPAPVGAPSYDAASAEAPSGTEAAASADAGAETSRDGNSASSGDDARALTEFKYAVDHLISRMSYEAKCEAVSYVIKKSGVSR